MNTTGHDFVRIQSQQQCPI